MSKTWLFAVSAFRPYDQSGRRLPWLLKIVRILGVLWPAATVVTLICAPFDSGSYAINGHPVSGPEFLARGGGATFVAVALFFGAVGVGIWQGRTWTRHALVAGLAAAFAISVVLQWERLGPDWWESLAPAAAVELAAVWYLYLKTATCAYYRSLGKPSCETAI